MSKQVAGTLMSILETPVMQAVMNRSSNIQSVVEEMKKRWSLDLYTRNPGPAVTDDGRFVGTDLDLACFMSALVDRRAVINLPTYKSKRVATVKQGERVISDKNRHGNIIGLSANKETFAFSVRVIDQNVVKTDSRTGREETGAPRNFMLVDMNGQWYEGWQRIEFSPSAIENDFLKDNRLWTGSSVIFKNFVHPNRWVSLYGQYYFQTKAIIERMTQEAKFLNEEIDRLLAAGIKFPTSGNGKKEEWSPKEKIGREKSETVKAMEVEVDLPEFTDSFVKIQNTQAELVRIADLRRQWVYTDIPIFRFACRSVELAFYQQAQKETSPVPDFVPAPPIPMWITGAKWEKNFVVQGKRKQWNRLVLFQPAVGEFGVAIRYRIYDKSERVASDSED